MANPFDEAGPAKSGGTTATVEKPAETKPANTTGADAGKPAEGAPAKDTKAGGDQPQPKKSLATLGGEEPQGGDKTNSDGKSESGDTKAKPGSKTGEGSEASKELSLKAPENSLLEKGALERISAEAKQRGLTQEQAQEIVERENQALTRFVKSQRQDLDRDVERWTKEANEDVNLGGANMKQTQLDTKAALDRFDPNGEVSKWLDDTGFGNHKILLGFLSNIGRAMRSQPLHGRGGGTDGQAPVTLGQALFGKVGKGT